MAKINPYINFNGNTEEAFGFYKSVFGGEFMAVMRWKDMPKSEDCEEMKLAESEFDRIMHISLPIGKENVLMGSDAIESMPQKLIEGNNFSISLNTESKEETEKLFGGLSEGGTVTMPLDDTFWGSYFGMCVDKFGIQWLFNYDYPKN
jgi:PhnB protein